MSSAPPQRELPRRWPSVAATVAAYALPGAAFAAQAFLSQQIPPWLFIALVVVGLVATAGAIQLQTIGARRNQQRLEAAEKTRDTLLASVASYLTPLADIKSRLVNADARELSACKTELIRAIVSSAADDLFPSKTRCSYFNLLDDGLTAKRLVCDAYTGRSNKLTCEFVEGKGVAGDYIFRKIIEPQSSELRGELTKADFHEWDENLGFRSGIACAVFSGNKTFGMLLWDAPDVNALDGTHHQMAQLLAQELGIMLVAINRFKGLGS